MQKTVTQLARRPAERFVGRSAVGQAALVLGVASFAALVALVETRSPLLGIDQQVAAWLNRAVSGNPPLLSALGLITTLGSSPVSWLVLSTLTVGLLVRGQSKLACYVAVTGLGAGVLSPSLKELVGRLRPMVETPVASAAGHSFPSGHAMGSVVVYGVLLLVFLPVLPRGARRPVIAAAVILVTAIGFTRLALGVHFLSDVMAGWLLGLGWLTVTIAAFRAWQGTEGPPVALELVPGPAPPLSPGADAAEPVLAHRWRWGAELLVSWVLLLGVVLAAGWLVSQALPGTSVARVDASVVQWLAQHRTPTWTTLAQLAGSLGSTAVVALAVVGTTLALAVVRQWRPALFVAVVMAGEAALFLATASIINRPRPPVDPLGPTLPPMSSFPSGQVAAAIALWRWVVLAGAVLAAALVAIARCYDGVHYPSDALGSVLLAVPWLVVTWYVLLPGPSDQAWVWCR